MALDNQKLLSWMYDLSESPLAAQHPEVANVIESHRVSVLRAAEFLNEDGFNNAVGEFKADLLSTLAFNDPDNHFDRIIPESFEGMEKEDILNNLAMQGMFQQRCASGVAATVSDEAIARTLMSSLKGVNIRNVFNDYLNSSPASYDNLMEMKRPTLLYVPNIGIEHLRVAIYQYTSGNVDMDPATEFVNSLAVPDPIPSSKGNPPWLVYIVDGQGNTDVASRSYPAKFPNQDTLMDIRTFFMLHVLSYHAEKDFSSYDGTDSAGSTLLRDINKDGNSVLLTATDVITDTPGVLRYVFEPIEDDALVEELIEVRRAVRIL